MFEIEALLFAGLLFVLRVVNYSISTMRLVFIARNSLSLSAVAAFLEALIFAVVMASVVTDLSNLLNLGAYCLGAAVGSYTGMRLEARFITSYRTVNIVCQEKGREIAKALRDAGFGVTETSGHGRDGEVTILRSTAPRRSMPAVMKIINEINPDAFIEVEEARALRRGWIPGGPPRRG